MNILNKIIAEKRRDLERQQAQVSTTQLEKSLYFNADVPSFKAFITNAEKSGIIAEFKRHSPSKGDINTAAPVATTTRGYAKAGASALSILTDTPFFKGTNEDLSEARQYNEIPILRKDFIIDEYQIIEAKSIGAAAILLIAECLTAKEVQQLAAFAQSLGVQVLLEVHSEKELEKATPDVDVIGVNNRDLTTFKVDIQTSLDLVTAIPNDFVKISESGLNHPETIVQLKTAGFQGFLIGEAFMKTERPAHACQQFIDAIAKIEPRKTALIE